METFDIACPSVSPSAKVTNRANRAVFGDGYEQAAADGINTRTRAWTLRFFGTKAAMQDVIDFLDAHGQWKRFTWTDPLGEEGVYRASEYDVGEIVGGKFSITVTFMQTYAV